MKTYHIYLGVIAILMWNAAIIQRDQQMFKQYDSMCATMKSDYHCRYAK